MIQLMPLVVPHESLYTQCLTESPQAPDKAGADAMSPL